MKSVGIQHLEAVRKLKAAGFVPRRTIHITFVPGTRDYKMLSGSQGISLKEIVNF